MLSKWLKRIALAGLCCLGATGARASAGIDAISYNAVPALTSAAINITIQGDTDSNAVVRLFYTTPARYQTMGAAAFTVDTGMVAIRRPKYSVVASGTGTSGWMQHALLLHLTPNTRYYYKVERTDDTSGTVLVGSAAIESVTTIAIPTRPTTGPRIYVSKSGSDANSGLSPDLPKLTINAALTTLAAQANAGAGGGVEVGPGIYYERLLVDFGSDAAGTYRYITGQRAARDSTIIDGSFTPSLDGYVLNDDTGIGGAGDPVLLAWVNTGQDSTYKAYFPSGDSVGAVVINWGEYVHRKASILEILNDAMGELSGWFWQNDTMYVKRKAGGSPQSATVHFAYGNIGDKNGTKDVPLLSLQKRNWHISNLTFRFSGTSNRTAGHAIAIGTTGGTSGAGAIIDSCRFYGSSGHAVYAPLWAGGAKGDSVLVTRNIFDGLTIGRMTYQAGKSRLEENTGSVAVLGRRPIIWRNTFRDLANGVGIGDGSTTPSDTSFAYNGSITENTFRYISDDALELEGVYGIGLLARNNNIRYTLSGISCAPVFSGPMFILFNTVSQYGFQGAGRGFKVGAANGVGVLCVWNNTFVTTGTNTSHGVEYVSGGTTDARNMSILNNVVVTRGTSLAYTYNLAALNDSTTNAINWNRGSTASTGLYAKFANTSRSFSQVRIAPIWEKNSVNTISFVDSTRANYMPLTTGGGRRITGVTNSWLGAMYSGSAPSIGAVMYARRGNSHAGRTTRAHLQKELQ